MPEEEISIRVSICDRFYPLRINAGIEENVRAAASLADKMAKDYNEKYSVKDKQDTLAMAALDLAADLLATQKSSTENNEAKQLLNEIERLLDSKLTA